VELVELFFTVVVPVGLVLMMTGMGLALSPADLKNVIVFPKAAAIGLGGQLLLLPLIAFLLAVLLAPTPAVAVGAVILAACPGGVTSNGFVFASRGDLALSITLTAVTSILTVFTIPLLTALAMYFFYHDEVIPRLPVVKMILRLAALTILPILAGMLFRRIWPVLADTLVEPLRRIAVWFLVILILGTIVSSREAIVENLYDAGMIALALNVLTMSAGFGLARLFGLSVAQTISITYEVGLQNLALALTVTLTILQFPALATVALVYIVFMNLSALGFYTLVRCYRARVSCSGNGRALPGPWASLRPSLRRAPGARAPCRPTPPRWPRGRSSTLRGTPRCRS